MKKTAPHHQYREAWLDAAVDLMRPMFAARKYKIPSKLRVSCGWPSRGGTSEKKRTLGQCWPAEADSKGVHQIFVSPYLDKAVDAQGVLEVLVHEIVHAVVGLSHGHDKVFKKCAEAMGLEGKVTAQEASDELMAHTKEWAGVLGEYPNGRLDLKKSPVKKQTTRLIKCECKECGYVCRTTKKWIEEVGAPHCPKHGAMFHDPIESDEDDDNE
jgi:rubrerythrin